MKLRSKLLVHLLLWYSIFALVSSLLLREYVLSNYAQLERETAHKDMERLVRLLEGSLLELRRTSADWTNWDELYNFVKDRNKHFYKGYLQPEKIALSDLHWLAIYNIKKQAVTLSGSQPLIRKPQV